MNPGSMKGLVAEESPVWLTPHDDPEAQTAVDLAGCGGG